MTDCTRMVTSFANATVELNTNAASAENNFTFVVTEILSPPFFIFAFIYAVSLCRVEGITRHPMMGKQIL